MKTLLAVASFASFLLCSAAWSAPTGEVYSIGGRPQRVRFLLASHGQTFDQMQQILGPDRSRSIVKLIEDPIQSEPDRPQGKFIRAARAPGEFPALSSFAEGNDSFVGLVINPGLVMCLANLLDRVKSVGDHHAALFNDEAIDEINL